MLCGELCEVEEVFRVSRGGLHAKTISVRFVIIWIGSRMGSTGGALRGRAGSISRGDLLDSGTPRCPGGGGGCKCGFTYL